MAANQYDVGDLIECSGAFTDADGLPLDPDVVLFKVRTPAGVSTTYTYGAPDGVVVRDGPGLYHAEVSITAAGRWYYRWQGTGTGQSAGETWFSVKSSQF